MTVRLTLVVMLTCQVTGFSAFTPPSTSKYSIKSRSTCGIRTRECSSIFLRSSRLKREPASTFRMQQNPDSPVPQLIGEVKLIYLISLLFISNQPLSLLRTPESSNWEHRKSNHGPSLSAFSRSSWAPCTSYG